jgi:3D (Asp-Asp-Asp) domain-containing protein
MIPFRTIAVDPHFVKLGSTLSVPQMKEARLPDGTIHDGIFVADDRGHFRGSHIDIFTGILLPFQLRLRAERNRS